MAYLFLVRPREATHCDSPVACFLSLRVFGWPRAAAFGTAAETYRRRVGSQRRMARLHGRCDTVRAGRHFPLLGFQRCRYRRRAEAALPIQGQLAMERLGP